MKKLIKKIIGYNKLYNTLKSSFLYQGWKKINGQIANIINGNPSKDFFVIGITGTNGKTTTANMLHQMFNNLIAPTVMISTACIKIGNETIVNDKKMTSLDVYDLQSLLVNAKNKGCKVAIIEVSSHGLEQYRFEGITFDYAILTNITKEHIDYHGDMHNYTKAKKKLFEYVMKNKKEIKYATLPADDKIGRERFDEMAFDKKINFSIQNSSMLKAENIKESVDQTYFDIKYLGNIYSTNSKTLGKYNVYNYLTALSVGIQIGLDINKCINILSNFDGVSGRMEKIEKNGITYFVDFAHSPDALDKTLQFLHRLKGENKLILVFGAPGNRDKTKRPEMGKIAWKYADIAIATDDDPDTENRLTIINELTKDIQKTDIPVGEDIFIIPERKLAIKFATEIAKPGDIVMLAGKGHEPIQWTNFGTRKWSDKEELLKNLK
ncbi:MAG TPA: UDP-N-acetylmuramoyl-L-alanyl-D-glutamate--2,6-diaminopimelate ligase [Candidatus Absconditabacterales bacterium]|nr:UDP-N-acetylmuramoyl-L-alanyl-D-glutamate--2,6-diaminopimelate ligase [Candidatus Absconditabacterales bacterium]